MKPLATLHPIPSISTPQQGGQWLDRFTSSRLMGSRVQFNPTYPLTLWEQPLDGTCDQPIDRNPTFELRHQRRSGRYSLASPVLE